MFEKSWNRDLHLVFTLNFFDDKYKFCTYISYFDYQFLLFFLTFIFFKGPFKHTFELLLFGQQLRF